ncbi:zinc finger CCCH domain-containing protein 66 [Ricinus communis]|uniref:Transcription factor, putative n=1 Tax=Ricinus communis TaxID=3988 RepID=B9SI36_RICCO|nr:zinc finger CCCH domain-containing protein 66 [Ricinus communis]XP_048228385.1 zinc finger CCCH domain-containing protein 66 [Ricinus communis]EEF36773.1 transcription factor, putative [Ricinus communis]|eukprot:XP_002525655.1 zinc finger CCCH domain-containing protein 66 [Ricinus communis]
MCSGSKRKPTHLGFIDELQKEDYFCYDLSILLELSASNDLIGFKRAIEEEGRDVDEPGLWYGRRIGSRKMGIEERTPLMIAALFGSKDVLNYILETGRADVNRGLGSDGATALHCAAAGGSAASLEVVKRLLDASADPSAVDANGNHAGDLIAPVVSSGLTSRRKALEIMLKGGSSGDEFCVLADQNPFEMYGQELQEVSTPRVSKDGTEKKEYPVDLTLPDIKNGIYGTDEFRMYTFKVKPCSRAYSHDWTECPFVHPGENARRRDPRKYHYSCVPCPEFRKGSCRQGDACEYAHGIFECWLHPAQYRTRLCKDEINCTRRVCFFAHKPEELRPLYASTGSAVPSPRSYSANGSTLDMGSISPLALGSPSVLIPPTSTPPMTPTGSSSPMGGWSNQSNIVPPTLQLPGSRLKSALSVRDMELEMELLGLDSHRRRQQLMDELSGLSSPSSWNNGLSTSSAFAASSSDRTGELHRLGGVKPTNLEDIFGSLDPSILPQLQGLSVDATSSQLQSPTGIQIRQNINQQLRSSYPTNFSSSPVRPSSFGIDPSGAAAAAVLTSRSAAFAKRSQSFVERSAVNRHTGFSSPTSSATIMASNFSDWGSPDGKLDWGIQGEELNKLRKSASFGIRNNGGAGAAATSLPATLNAPDVSWVQSLVKDAPSTSPRQLGFEEQQQCHLNTGNSEIFPAWVEQLYIEQEQMVA